MNPDYKPKLSIELTPEQSNALRSINLPHGWQRAIFTRIVDDLISLDHDYGPQALAIIIADATRPREVLPTLSSIESLGQKLF